MRRTSSLSVLVIAVVGVLAAAVISSCAFGAEDIGNAGDDDPSVDARPGGGNIDASLPADAAPPIDSSPLPIDAPPQPVDSGGGELFCNSTADCAGQPGTCCFMLGQPPGFCVPGQEVIGVCFPS